MQVTVQKIWPLDPTKKSGGFKATDGVNYYCEIGAYHLLQEGATYEANPRPYVSKAGKSSFIMPKDWHPPATVAGGNGASPPPPSPPYPPTNTSQPAPPPVQRTNGALGKEGEMFVMGVVGRAMGSGKFDITDVDLLTKAAIQAWRGNV